MPQVLITDIELEGISQTLGQLSYGKTGAGYITENLDGVDYMIGSSEGGVTAWVDGTAERITPAESPSSQIRNSYSLMTSSIGVTDTQLPGPATQPYGANMSGNVFEGL